MDFIKRSIGKLFAYAVCSLVLIVGTSTPSFATSSTSSEADGSALVVAAEEDQANFIESGTSWLTDVLGGQKDRHRSPSDEGRPKGFTYPYCSNNSTGKNNIRCVNFITEKICDTGQFLVAPFEVVNGVYRPVAGASKWCERPKEATDSDDPPEQVDLVQRPDLVAQEFRRVEMPKPMVVFQDEVEDQVAAGKMWGVAMRGQHMNMWADSPDHTTSVTLLGTEISIRATPLQYTWDYGNGETRVSAYAGEPVTPGAADRVAEMGTATSHLYEETGFYPVTVTTAYSGQFKTPTSDWIPIPGVATVTSPAKTATVWKNETRLVSGDCSENPGSWGCETVPFPWEGGPQSSEAFEAAQEDLEARQ